MELRRLELKEQYRSDEDDIVSDFLIPCLNNCTEYDRAVEYVTLSGLTTLSLGFHNSTPNARMRLISGHQFGIKDLNMMSKLFSENGKKWKNFNPGLIKDAKLEQIRRLIADGNLMLKIGIPNSENIDGVFSEKVGIFRDANGDSVVFSGSSSVMLARKSKNFETIDVFTSWNDKSRVETKIKNFERLWLDETSSIKTFDFEYAERNNLLKYSSEWAVNPN